VTLAVSFSSQSVSTSLLSELRSAACSSWQGVAQTSVKFEFIAVEYPVIRYRRVIVDAALTSVEHSSAVDHAQHLWLTAKT
jgi:hypothetical protein